MKTYPEYTNSLKMHLIFLMVFTVINFTDVFAQKVYQTSSGLLLINAYLDDKPLKISSKGLIILLEYETGKLLIKQEVSALISDNDSIQSRLNSMENEYITFEGKLGLDYINTKGHPPLDFNVEGTMYPGNNHVLGNGHLEHIDQGASTACLLSLTFKLKPDEVFPDHFLEGFDSEIYVTVLQSLLPRVGD